ncbi:MAG: phage protease [Gammaproteobacteria bacterium]|nr:phage protease [Gammaproteobacteria bacterium]
MYQTPQLCSALNHAAASDYLQAALCFELPQDGTAPEWVQLIPVGDVVGRDTRKWINDEPESVIAQTLNQVRDIPLDWEHSTELKAPKGEQAPAAAWFKEYKVEGGFIWGRLDWKEKGRNSVESGEYRYISPVFDFTKLDGRIYRITSVGLTNRPNLYLNALNREGTPHSSSPGNQKEHSTMTYEELMALLRTGLGLDTNADHQVALNSIATLRGDLATAMNQAQTPSLERFVPRADYDKVVERATNAEQALKDDQDSKKQEAIETAVNGALEAGKIHPDSKDYHTAACQQEGGLEKFEKFVASAPVIVGDSGLDKKKADADKGTALNAEEQSMAEMFGNSAEDIHKYGQ